MIEHVSIRNFRCFEHVEVDLRPLTILIGQNDSGKSSFLLALQRLADGSTLGDDIRRSSSRGRPVLVARANGQQIKVTEGPHSGELALLRPRTLFTLPSSGVAMGSPGAPEIPEIDSVGNNIPTLVDYFLRKDRKRFDSFVNAMRKRVPGLEEINVTTPEPSWRQLELVIDGGFPVPAANVSAGVRLLLFFVALAHHPAPPKLILLEEPENGLHPRRMADVIRLLRGITVGEFGPQKSQVILTTHSPLLLDEVDLEKDQVLVFKREENGERSVQAADRDRLKKFLDEFRLGEVWFNKGETGLVPKAEGASS